MQTKYFNIKKFEGVFERRVSEATFSKRDTKKMHPGTAAGDALMMGRAKAIAGCCLMGWK
jgi:hypothetical protein